MYSIFAWVKVHGLLSLEHIYSAYSVEPLTPGCISEVLISPHNYSKPDLSPSKRCTCSGTMNKPFPVDGGMTSFWRSQPDTLDNHRSTESLPESSDIVIVGAGYTGAATAYHCLAQSQRSQAKCPSIVILEARQACSGATGRNGRFRTYPSL